MSINHNFLRSIVSMIALSFAATGCHEITEAPQSTGVITLEMPDVATADGSSVIQLRATLDTMRARDQWKVTFGTTAGRINDTEGDVEVKANVDGVATAFLRVPGDSAQGIVSATSANVVRTKSITFRRARANSVVVDLDKFVIDTGFANFASVTVTLLRRIGTPSPADTVHLDARDNAGNAIGKFSTPSRTNALGQATARYTVGDRAYSGQIRITATVRGDADTLVSGSAVLQSRIPASLVEFRNRE